MSCKHETAMRQKMTHRVEDHKIGQCHRRLRRRNYLLSKWNRKGSGWKIHIGRHRVSAIWSQWHTKPFPEKLPVQQLPEIVALLSPKLPWKPYSTAPQRVQHCCTAKYLLVWCVTSACRREQHCCTGKCWNILAFAAFWCITSLVTNCCTCSTDKKLLVSSNNRY